MPLTDREKWDRYVELHRHKGDPPPRWLTKEQIAVFTKVQNRFNAKIDEIEAQKHLELQKALFRQ